jgi:hypothetical protein
MFHRRSVEILGASHQRVYGRLAVIFVESSFITSTCRLVWMAAFASGVQNVVSWVESIAAYGSASVIFSLSTVSHDLHIAIRPPLRHLPHGQLPGISKRDHIQHWGRELDHGIWKLQGCSQFRFYSVQHDLYHPKVYSAAGRFLSQSVRILGHWQSIRPDQL